MSVEVDHFDGVAAVALGDTMLALWRSPARRERVRWIAGWAADWLEATPGSVAACQLLLPTASPPDHEARAEALLGYRIVAPRARRLITVPLGDEGWRGLVRGIIRAGLVVTGRSELIKVAAHEGEAFDLLDEIATTRSPSRRQLEAALDALYLTLGLGPPRPPRRGG